MDVAHAIFRPFQHVLPTQHQNALLVVHEMTNDGSQQFAIVLSGLIDARREGHVESVDDAIEGRICGEELFEFTQFRRRGLDKHIATNENTFEER